MHGSGPSFSRGEGKAGVVNTDRPSGRRAGVRGDRWSLLVVVPVCAATVGRSPGHRAGVCGDCWSFLWSSRRRARQPLVVPLVVAPACAATVGLSWSSRRRARQPLVFLWSSRRRARRSLVRFLWSLHLSSRRAGVVSIPMSSTTSHVFHPLPHIILHPHVILSSGTSSPTCHLLPTSTSTIHLGAAGNRL